MHPQRTIASSRPSLRKLRDICLSSVRLAVVPTVSPCFPRVLYLTFMKSLLPTITALALFAPLIAFAAPHLTLLNPGMDAGAEEPSGWAQRSGEAVIVRDTQTFHTGPASLLLDHLGKSGSATVGQNIVAPAGLKFKIGGWLKTSGQAKVNLLVQSFSDHWNCLDTQQVKFGMNDSDWSHGEKEITLPEKTVILGISLFVEGDGKAWLDDVTLTSDEAEVTVKTDLPAEKPRPHAPAEPKEPTLIPITATPGFYEQYPDAWQGMHQTNLDIVKKHAGPVDILLIGDSITLGWGGAWDGKPVNEVWQKYFGQHSMINLGIGGDKTQNVLWRLENGEVAGLQPKLVVLAIGVNNVWNWAVPADAVAQGVKKCVATIHAKLPAAKILVVNLLPTQEKLDAPNRGRANDIRAEIAKLSLDNGTTVRFANFGDRFLEADGSIAKENMSDFLHPTQKGYKIYAAAIAPVIGEMLR